MHAINVVTKAIQLEIATKVVLTLMFNEVMIINVIREVRVFVFTINQVMDASSTISGTPIEKRRASVLLIPVLPIPFPLSFDILFNLSGAGSSSFIYFNPNR